MKTTEELAAIILVELIKREKQGRTNYTGTLVADTSSTHSERTRACEDAICLLVDKNIIFEAGGQIHITNREQARDVRQALGTTRHDVVIDNLRASFAQTESAPTGG